MKMSGANYYISFVQLIESERKLRFKNSIIISTKNDNISLKSLEPYEESNQEVYMNIYHCLLVGEFSLEFVPSDLLPIVTYIGGYVANKKLKKHKCDICCCWLLLGNSVDVLDTTYELIKALDRGKLTLPSELVVTVVSITWYLLKNIVSYHEDHFLKSGNQLAVLHKLCCVQISQLQIGTSEICNCVKTLLSQLESICLLTCKVLLNNYIKYKNNMLHKSEKNCNRKIKKLCTRN